MSARLHPWRDVVGRPMMRTGRGSVLGPDTSRRTAWWEGELSCGHGFERTVRYVPQEGASRGGTQHRSKGDDDVMPHPRRVRCTSCPVD